MVLLGGLGRLLELLILRPVVFQYCNQLLLLFNLKLSLLLIGFDLLLELLGLRVDLIRQGVLDPARLAILLAKLCRHELHLFCALFLQLLVLHLQIGCLLLNELVFFPGLRHIFSHLSSDSAEVIVEVFQDLLALRLLIILDRDVPLLELLVLTIVLARDLLIFLPNDVRFAATILILQCLLVKELLFDLSLDCGYIDLLLQRLHPVQEQFVECVRALLK